jgi:hypothetical protein
MRSFSLRVGTTQNSGPRPNFEQRGLFAAGLTPSHSREGVVIFCNGITMAWSGS